MGSALSLGQDRVNERTPDRDEVPALPASSAVMGQEEPQLAGLSPVLPPRSERRARPPPRHSAESALSPR
jgi:hypothetical protein